MREKRDRDYAQVGTLAGWQVLINHRLRERIDFLCDCLAELFCRGIIFVIEVQVDTQIVPDVT